MKIAVLDTGLGGLDILNKLIKKYPHNEYLYFCDNLHCPYGVRKKEEVESLVVKILSILEKLNINMLVVACNTISSVIDKFKDDISFPIYTILDANAKLLNEKYQYKKVSVIATSLTIRNEAYFYKTNNIDFQFINGSYLTSLIEKGNEEEIEKEIIKLIKQCAKDSEIILLGCTHYALYKNLFIKNCHNKLFVEASKELVYSLPLGSFNSFYNLNLLFTDLNSNYIEKIEKFIIGKYNAHKVVLGNI